MTAQSSCFWFTNFNVPPCLLPKTTSELLYNLYCFMCKKFSKNICSQKRFADHYLRNMRIVHHSCHFKIMHNSRIPHQHLGQVYYAERILSNYGLSLFITLYIKYINNSVYMLIYKLRNNTWFSFPKTINIRFILFKLNQV